MGDKKYSAMPAKAKATQKLRLLPHDQPHHGVVRQYRFPHLYTAVPTPDILKTTSQFYCKEASLSLIIFMFFPLVLSLLQRQIAGQDETIFERLPITVNFSAVHSECRASRTQAHPSFFAVSLGSARRGRRSV
jgi:hypothetical protein